MNASENKSTFGGCMGFARKVWWSKPVETSLTAAQLRKYSRVSKEISRCQPHFKEERIARLAKKASLYA
jgi:hypothetical protein